jgi:L-ascorbate metabolism protein UlaG (beta-lactamase superfamily)
VTAGSVTWVGHATAVVESGGVRVMTHPLLRRRVAHLRCRVSPVPADVGAGVDLVLISNAHMDHLHVPSLRTIAPDVPVVAPRGRDVCWPGPGGATGFGADDGIVPPD